MGKDIYFTRDDAEEFCSVINSNESFCNRMLIIRDDLEKHFCIPEQNEQQALTREQAINRVMDIKGRHSVDHLTSMDGWKSYHMSLGAINELMAIFDIKEEELK